MKSCAGNKSNGPADVKQTKHEKAAVAPKGHNKQKKGSNNVTAKSKTTKLMEF